MAKSVNKSLSLEDKKMLKKFGASIKSLREKRNLSVYDITGDDMMIRSRQHWHAIEAGLKNINLTTAIKIARTLKVPLNKLLEEIE